MCTMEAYVAMRVLQGYSQYRADKSKANWINRTTDTKAANLREEAIYKDKALIRKKEVKEDQLGKKKFDILVKEQKTIGVAKLAFFEKGIGGNLYNTVVGDILRQSGRSKNTVDINYENFIRGISADRLAWNRRFGNQIINLPRAHKPSFMTYALDVGMDIGGMYMANQAPDTPADGFDNSYQESYDWEADK